MRCSSRARRSRAAGLRVEPGRTSNFWYFQPNRAHSEFGDARVRRALWHAIDRRALIEGLARGNGSLSAQPVPDWSFAHAPGIGPDPYPYDPARARALLAEAGLPSGFTFEALVSASPDVLRHAEAIQADLADVGITMRMRMLEPAQITDVFFSREEGDLMLGRAAAAPTRPRPPGSATRPVAS